MRKKKHNVLKGNGHAKAKMYMKDAVIVICCA